MNRNINTVSLEEDDGLSDTAVAAAFVDLKTSQKKRSCPEMYRGFAPDQVSAGDDIENPSPGLEWETAHSEAESAASDVAPSSKEAESAARDEDIRPRETSLPSVVEPRTTNENSRSGTQGVGWVSGQQLW